MNENFQFIFNQLLMDHRLLSIPSFKSKKINKFDIFPDAKDLPSFFSYNLLNEGRVVKLLKGPEAVWRGFYYQLMKLGFQIQNPRDDYSQLIKNAIFNDPEVQNLKNSSPISGKRYSHRQYLKIIAEFMEVLESSVIPNFQMSLNQYPIFDEAMLSCLEYMLEKYIHFKGVKVQSILEVLQILCTIFEIKLEVYENCVKFIESDTFMYFEDSGQLYLAFLNQMAEIDECEKTSEEVRSREKELKDFSRQASGIESLQDYAQRSDIRLSAGNNKTRKRIENIGVMNRNSTGGIIQKQNPKSAIINVFENEQAQSEKEKSKSKVEDEKLQFSEEFKKSSEVGSLGNLSELKEDFSKISQNSKQKQLLEQENAIFFYPQKQKCMQKKEKVLEKRADESLGTYYRQFSDTKIMEAMIEPFKSKVGRTRSRFKGVRSEEFRGFY